jgi:hypothetical protein
MRALHKAIVPGVVLSLLLAAGTVANDVRSAPADADGAATIAMVEVVSERETVRGRILHETEDQIKVESFGNGVIGYRKSDLREIRRFTLPAGSYYEELGDLHLLNAWEADDAAAEFIKARQAYVTAAGRSLQQSDRDQIMTKLDLLAEEREEWQREALRREQLKQAQEQTELTRLQKQIAAEQLAVGRRQEQYIKEIEKAFREMQDQTQRMGDFVRLLEQKIEDLEDDVDRLDRVYITNQVFLDLRRSHQALEREVRRLERSVDGR